MKPTEVAEGAPPAPHQEPMIVEMPRDVLVALAGDDIPRQQLLAAWDRENELRRAAEDELAKLRALVASPAPPAETPEYCPQCDENSRCGHEWHQKAEAASPLNLKHAELEIAVANYRTLVTSLKCGQKMLEDKIAELEAAFPLPRWQGISTAPKDGTPVHLKWQGTTVEAVGRWNKGNNLRFAEANWRDVEGDDVLTLPTHWALPAPPQETP